MSKPTEAEIIQEALDKVRAKRAEWVQEEYKAVFEHLDIQKVSPGLFKGLLEIALTRGYSEGLAAAGEVLRPDLREEAVKMLERNPIIEACADDRIKH